MNTSINIVDKKLKLSIILIVFIFIILGCAGKNSPVIKQSGEVAPGGTLVSTTTVNPKTFNPVLAEETPSSEIINYYVFEPLVVPNGQTMEMEPCLARNWKVSKRGLVWTFYLRKDVKWSDGEEFTAEDVVFTFKVIYDEDIPTHYREELTIEGEKIDVEALGKYTVKLTLPRTYAPLLRQLPLIIPKHKLYDDWKDERFKVAWTSYTPPEEIVGTGPFMLSEYQKGAKVVMKKNPHYWRRDEVGRQLPYLDKWVRRIVNGIEDKIAEFKDGGVHHVELQNQHYLRLKEEAESENYQLINGGPGLNSTFIVFNMNPDNPKLKKEPWKLDWFTNLYFRRAVAYAVDREKIINQVFGGFAVPQWSPVSKQNKLFYNGEVKRYTYDLNKAREALKKGGFNWNKKGDLIDENGRKVEFRLVTNEGSRERQRMLRIIAQDLEKLGMSVNINLVEFDRMINQLTRSYEYDGILIGLKSSGLDPNEEADIWKSSGVLHLWSPKQTNPSTHWEEKIDNLFKQGKRETNLEKRKEVYGKWQELAAEYVPIIYIVNKDQVFAVKERVKNTKITSYANAVWGEPLWNIYEVYLQQ